VVKGGLWGSTFGFTLAVMKRNRKTRRRRLRNVQGKPVENTAGSGSLGPSRKAADRDKAAPPTGMEWTTIKGEGRAGVKSGDEGETARRGIQPLWAGSFSSWVRGAHDAGKGGGGEEGALKKAFLTSRRVCGRLRGLQGLCFNFLQDPHREGVLW